MGYASFYILLILMTIIVKILFPQYLGFVSSTIMLSLIVKVIAIIGGLTWEEIAQRNTLRG